MKNKTLIYRLNREDFFCIMCRGLNHLLLFSVYSFSAKPGWSKPAFQLLADLPAMLLYIFFPGTLSRQMERGSESPWSNEWINLRVYFPKKELLKLDISK